MEKDVSEMIFSSSKSKAFQVSLATSKVFGSGGRGIVLQRNEKTGQWSQYALNA